MMKTENEIAEALSNIDTSSSKYFGMTYEQGLEEALLWVIEELEDEDFAPISDVR